MVLIALVTTIDLMPLDESEVVTLIWVGGPGIVCVNAHAGGVLSRRITLFTVRTNEPPTELMTTDAAGVYVGADHTNPAIGASAASVIVHVFPVGMPVTVAGLLGETDLLPVKPVPQL